MKQNMFKQYQIKWIGRFVQITYQTMPLINILIQGFTIAITYRVWQSGILSVFPWISLPVFIGLVILIALFLMWFNHVVIYKGYWYHQNTQQFPEDGEVAKLIRKIIREELDKDKNESH